MGTDPEEFLGYNPFTASLEIKLHSDYANSDSIAKIEKMIKKNSNIQDVLYRKDCFSVPDREGSIIGYREKQVFTVGRYLGMAGGAIMLLVYGWAWQ